MFAFIIRPVEAIRARIRSVMNIRRTGGKALPSADIANVPAEPGGTCIRSGPGAAAVRGIIRTS